GPSAAHGLLLGLLLILAGCKDRVPVPAVDPKQAGEAAVRQYDRNGDGVLDAQELERCPALRGALRALDKGRDGRLSAAAIAARIADYQTNKLGLVCFSCRVYLDDKPLAGATVTFVPEQFMGPGVKSASGVSDEKGAVELLTQGAAVPGVACGFYTIKVSKKSGDREIVPGRYNAQTVLGQEVGPDTH